MDDFIRVYDNAIDEKTCEILIHMFDISGYKQIVKNGGTPNFTILNLNQKHPEVIKLLSGITVDCLKNYKKDFPDYTRWYPQRLFLEDFRIKKYHSRSPDRFDVHVDVGDHGTAVRYLSFIYYLNDDFTGGETDFPTYSKKIVPKKGSVMIFPPTWQYPHAGLRVNKGVKYIMSTYCHYY